MEPLVRLDTEAAPTFTVRLTDDAYQAMGNQAYAQRGEIETGGALFGHPARDQDDSVTVKRAGDPSPATRSSRNRLTVDMALIVREAEALNDSGSSIGWIGFWHTHPTVDGDVPSDHDLRCFANNCRELREMGRTPNHYVGLILTPNWEQDRSTFDQYASWAKPTVTAWHMNAVSDDQFICTKAEVVRC